MNHSAVFLVARQSITYPDFKIIKPRILFRKFSLVALHANAMEGKFPQRWFAPNFEEPSRRKFAVRM
jgi:hypothetical protein